MASRRDELNAYTFAKKRLLAAFLQPTPSGTEEGAPRPLRAVVPGLIIGVVIMAGFGAWGMFKPKAPEGWDEPGQKVIIGSDSTTRYVVLKTDGKTQLHPVLNLASAKLLLDPDKFEIVEVDEKTLDNGDIPHGATIGIPYAPDRLPDAGEASESKRWAVCTQPGANGRSAQKAAFVLADREKSKVEGKSRLRAGDVMYVEGPGDKLYVVDKSGTAYPIARDPNLLLNVVGKTRNEPQQVTEDWLKTLKKGDAIQFPTVERIGDPAGVPGNLDANANKIGTVLKADTGDGPQHYVVLDKQVRPVTDFMAKLLLNSKESISLGQHGKPTAVSLGAISPSNDVYGGNLEWPEDEAETVNKSSGDRDTLCNVLRDVDKKEGTTTLSTWASDDYPAALPNGATSAYVSPGSGLLFRQVKGQDTKSGGVFLVTDTGLRYAVQGNADSGEDESGIGSDGKKKTKEQAQEEGNRAQLRLGFKDATPVPVPAVWSQFLPTGPRLSTSAAKQPQGS
ncbi:type VII secretion protein EccB [Streptomyces sp. N2-109]|uniref:Type VII secretion protein EccB n=1 Tax=Streptomyces gossypii TaxID=2883101 RepID=A0ABT2K5D1_9ACTN|nr:type VII secretion protein EccB [Streptomyces gossypii]MCT2594700.1 type VII secretion protein EccB [Streptomyces gossypii]